MSPLLAPRGRTGDPGASTEIAPSHGIAGLVIDGLLTPVSPPLWAFRLRDPSLHQTRQAQATKLGRQHLPLSILSVGYTDTASGCPPMAPACQRKQENSHRL
jgi:hypothetical protein